jgi:hypothetical protein
MKAGRVMTELRSFRVKLFKEAAGKACFRAVLEGPRGFGRWFICITKRYVLHNATSASSVVGSRIELCAGWSTGEARRQASGVRSSRSL